MVGAIGVALLLTVVVAPSAVAVNPPIPTLQWINDPTLGFRDQFRNFDQGCKSPSCAVDWGVDFIFFNQANVPRIKTLLNGYFPRIGSNYQLNLILATGFNMWDDDKGVKTDEFNPHCEDSIQYHMRLYAPNPPDHFLGYDPGWGFYVIGTNHIDYEEECGPSLKFGWSEQSEYYTAQVLAAIGSSTTYRYTAMGKFLKNEDGIYDSPCVRPLPGLPVTVPCPRQSGNRYMQNDGYPTLTYLS